MIIITKSNPSYHFVFLVHFFQLGRFQEEIVLVLGLLAEQEVSRSVLIEHANRVVNLNVEVIQHAGNFVASGGNSLSRARLQFVPAKE